MKRYIFIALSLVIAQLLAAQQDPSMAGQDPAAKRSWTDWLASPRQITLSASALIIPMNPFRKTNKIPKVAP